MRKINAAVFVVLFLTSICLAQRAPVFGRTMIFSQAQLKYSLQHGNYFTYWVDWPLSMDASLKEENINFRGLQYPDYQKIQENMKLYDLDGLLFWQAHVRFGWCSDIIDFTRRSQLRDFKLVANFSSTFDPELDAPPILQSPDFLRLNDKVIVNLHSRDWREHVKAVKEKFPERFLFLGLGHLNWAHRAKINNGEALSDSEVETIRQTVREQLQFYDGFGWEDTCVWTKLEHGKKRFATEFHREMTRIAAEVFQEPEFKDKIFLGETVCGHENPSAHGYILSSDGTRTLRDSLQNNLDHGVDLINIPEWDEQNENTSLRPTVFNSYAHARILRYYMRHLKKQPPYHLPGDDLSQPPLIISMRKILTLGEKAEFELLNVPDNDTAQEYTATLAIKSLSGQILHQFPTVTLQASKLQEQRLELPTEKLATERVLLPELTVTFQGQEFHYSEGLPCICIQPTWNFDYKWVKQPLRDLLAITDASFQVAPAETSSNLLAVEANVSASEQLAFAEVLDNWDCVYSLADQQKFPWRENEDFYVFRIRYKAVRNNVKFSGSFRVEGADPIFLPSSNQTTALPHPVLWNDSPAGIWHRGFHVAIRRDEAQGAAFIIELQDLFSQTIPLSEAVDKQTMAFGGQDGFSFIIQRELRQWSHPERLNKRQVNLKTNIFPDHLSSVLQLQLISTSGKIWRSRPLLSAPLAQETLPVTVFSETAGHPVTVSAPRNLVPEISYQWDNGRGLVAVTEAGRPFYAMRGSYHDLASFRGGGGDQSADGIAPNQRQANAFWPEPGNLAPSVSLDANGQQILTFDGNGQFVALPQGVIPRRTAFKLSFEIKPEQTKRRQTLLVSRRNVAGTISEFYLENDTVTAKYFNDKIKTFNVTSEAPVVAGQWSQITLEYDLSQLRLIVNGVTSPSVAAPGPGLYDHPAFLGGWKDTWFAGELKNFSVSHQAPTNAN